MRPQEQDVDRAISDRAGRLLDLSRGHSHSAESNARLSFLLGALYFLRQAWRLGFRGFAFSDSTDQQHGDRLLQVAQTLADGGAAEPQSAWVAGIYFAMAKARLAFAYERELRLLTGNEGFVSREALLDQARARYGGAVEAPHLKEIAMDINAVKHKPKHFLRPSRVESFAEVIRAVDELLDLVLLPRQAAGD